MIVGIRDAPLGPVSTRTQFCRFLLFSKQRIITLKNVGTD